MSEGRTPPAKRGAFGHFRAIPTRWMDNDVYGHVNNVVYYSWFDTLIGRYLIEEGGLDIEHGAVIGVAVESGCRYHRSFTFPETVEAGLRVAHLGQRSARYEIGLFAPGEDDARAEGFFVHVFVGREDRGPTPPPEKLRQALARLVKA